MALTNIDLDNEAEQDVATQVARKAIEMNTSGGPVLCIAGSGPGTSVSRRLKKELPFETVELKAAVLSTSEEIASLAMNSNADLVVGIGGGAVIDRAKLAAKAARARYLAVPTALSQDGLYTEHAVLRDLSGGVERFRCSPPDAVLPATAMIEGAPPVFRAACVGDLLSNLSAVEDCVLAKKAGKYTVHDRAIELSLEAANIAAESDADGSPMELFEAIKLSGEAMRIEGGSTPCSGAEHKIDHALNLVTGRVRSHGLTVAFATAFLTTLRSPNRLNETLRVLQRHGLPLEPTDLDVQPEEFVEAVGVACDLRPSRYTILDHRRPSSHEVRDALQEMTKQKVAIL